MANKTIFVPGMKKSSEISIFGNCVKGKLEEDNASLLASSAGGSGCQAYVCVICGHLQTGHECWQVAMLIVWQW